MDDTGWFDYGPHDAKEDTLEDISQRDDQVDIRGGKRGEIEWNDHPSDPRCAISLHAGLYSEDHYSLSAVPESSESKDRTPPVTAAGIPMEYGQLLEASTWARQWYI
jgi:hypothetical protein